MGKSLSGVELGRGITQRKDGIFQGSVVLDSGKRQTVYSKDLNTVRIKLIQLSIPKVETNRDVTLNDWFETCMDIHKKQCRDTTIRTYRMQYASLKKRIGYLYLTDLTKTKLQAALNELPSDIARVHARALLIDILNLAKDDELIERNVARGLKTNIAHDEKGEKRILSDGEIEKLKNIMYKEGSLYMIFVLALNTGMRIGEILGLRRSDVDFEKREVHVNGTLCYMPNGGNAIYELHETKTKAGRRTIPMTREATDILESAFARKRRIESRHSAYYGLEDLIFVSRINRPIHSTNIRAAFNYYTDLANVDHFTPHALRHTFATKCIAKGMKPKVLQKILGHKQLSTTMDIYCHVEKDTMRDEMEKIFVL